MKLLACLLSLCCVCVCGAYGHAFELPVQYCSSESKCRSLCYDKYWTCKDRCGPNSEDTSCGRKCVSRKENCLDRCSGSSDSSPNSSRSAMTSRTKPKEREYCYEFDNEVEIIEYEAEKAVADGHYCTAISKLREVISKLSRPPEVCEQHGTWMSVFLKKKQWSEERIDKYRPMCKQNVGEQGSDITIKKDAGGITLIQQ